jgi:predicted GNAT superfamily acetyltransferase
MPAHAFVSTKTNNELVLLEDTTEFSVKNSEGKNTNTPIFFTPFTQEQIIEGSIVFQYYNSFLIHPNGVEALNDNYKVPDYKMWIGLSCNENTINTIQSLKIAFITENSNLDHYLKFVQVKDAFGNVVPIKNEDYAEVQDNKQYTEKIKTFYKNFVYTLNLKPENIVFNSISDQFTMERETLKCAEAKLKVIWLEFTFPELFTKEELDKITLKINTFPVINRKLNHKTHQVKNEGRWFSMKGSRYSHFLDVHKIADQENMPYENSLKLPLNATQKRTYTLFYGGLENYDPRNAKFFLKKLARVLREDISAFASINADYIDATMVKINQEITNIEQKINSSFSDFNDKDDVFALIKTLDDIQMLYCTYWTSEGSLANNFKKGTVLKQAELSELVQDETILATTSTGGAFRTDKAEKLINLRYGFLTKERLVTAQDIKAAVHFHLRNISKEVCVKNGVGIGLDKKKGLHRTIDVTIQLHNDTSLEEQTKKKMEVFLKETLEEQSVMNIPFQITIK